MIAGKHMDIPTSKPESREASRRVGIIMLGVTGRMGTNQHLQRSIAEIRGEGLLIGMRPERALAA